MAELQRVEAISKFSSMATKLSDANDPPKLLADMTVQAAIMYEQPVPDISFPKKQEPLDFENPKEIDSSIIIQNRDRSTITSVLQMRKIAANPNYLKLSGSNAFGEGAPVVAYGKVPKSQLGKIVEAVFPDDSEPIKVQYAVVDVNDILTSSNIDGTTDDAYYSKDPSHIRAIAGNGRITAMKQAYKQGSADKYKAALKADKSHGISEDVIDKVSNPILVRVMQPKDVTSDIGDKSNTTSNIGMSKVETAKNDRNRLDVRKLELQKDGGLTVQAMRDFLAKIPDTEQAQLIDTKRKQPNQECERRLMNAMFMDAYDVKISGNGNKINVADDLLETKVESIDPTDKVITQALYLAAPTLSKLKGLKDGYDIRDIVVSAAYSALEAKRKGIPIGDMAANTDMFQTNDTTDAVSLIMGVFAENLRSPKKCADKLIKIGNELLREINEEKDSQDMFAEIGEYEALPAATVISHALEKVNESEGLLLDSVYDYENNPLTPAQRAFWNSELGCNCLKELLDMPSIPVNKYMLGILEQRDPLCY